MGAIGKINHEGKRVKEFIMCSNRACNNEVAYNYYSTQHAIDDGWRADRSSGKEYLYCPKCAERKTNER